ncbi:MAG: MoaD/ThiS family protein [Sulfuricella sp.]|nr:MoaD/ThiS family protein [Gammaproteobacteria bacterium]
MATLMYFAQLAETLGRTSEQVALPASVGDVNALIEWLGRREGAGWKSLAGGKNVAVMVNRRPATMESAINNNDEIAFIPERLK